MSLETFLHSTVECHITRIRVRARGLGLGLPVRGDAWEAMCRAAFLSLNLIFAAFSMQF